MKFLITTRLFDLVKYRNIQRWNKRYYATAGCTDFKVSPYVLDVQIKHEIESHWRDKIQNTPFDPSKPDKKFVVVPMFPYPSGILHLGHVRVYTISDAIARFQRLQGKNVLHPIGWDAFGLPAENAAIERKISPNDWTKSNIEHMKKQLNLLGCSFDWSRELATCDPVYYKWTQWLFLQLYKDNLLYQGEAPVNWDPVDQTVLANEQIDENGKSWRSGAKAEKKYLKQWFVRTTNFAKDLYDGLNETDSRSWENVMKMQKNWFGEPNGYKFTLELFSIAADAKAKSITIWTDKPEKLQNPGFIAVKSSHYIGGGNNSERLLDVAVKNPFDEGSLIPLLVCDDLEYEKHCDTYIGTPANNEADRSLAERLWVQFEDKAPNDKNRESIVKKAKAKHIGGHMVSAHFGDWLISRQRYWGTPIPIIHCAGCGTLPVPESALPVLLPEAKFDEGGRPIPLSKRDDWLTTKCHKCGKLDAKRESDTMDTFVDSSWYFLRYLSPSDEKVVFDKSLAKKVMPVDVYIGGIEHAVLHLYLARFFMHFLKKLNYVATREPFKQLITQGMVNGKTYLSSDGRYLNEGQVNVLNEREGRAEETLTGKPVRIEWEKMSKSKKNGVDPCELFEDYSVDTIRMIMLADTAPRSPRNWSKDTFRGIIKWQQCIWVALTDLNKARSSDANGKTDENAELKMLYHKNKYVGRACHTYANGSLNSAIKSCHALTDSIQAYPKGSVANSEQYEQALGSLLIMISPIAPLFASECWSKFLSIPSRIEANQNYFKWDEDVLQQSWPKLDEEMKNLIVIQINGNETVFKRNKDTPVEITKEYLLEKANELSSLQELLKTHNITEVSFANKPDSNAKLCIELERKNKEKKGKKQPKQKKQSP